MPKNFYLCIVKKTISFNNTPAVNLTQQALSAWVYECVEERGGKIKRLVINFITEDEMLNLNQKYLKHDTHTDILTFL